ncbi:MAG TPA: cupredoxin family copper-binding protein [Acetobacteraceae bacterium]|nr:cupredoxin family copper-binding protein [Acetobacteraceae bacterium]
MTRLVALMACALLLAVPSVPAHAEDAPQERQISIDNFTFTPAEITVPRGTRVVWTNHDDIPHMVVDAANPKAVKSPPMDTGDAYARRFDAPGTYRYFCSLHPHMQGTIIVR